MTGIEGLVSTLLMHDGGAAKGGEDGSDRSVKVQDSPAVDESEKSLDAKAM